MATSAPTLNLAATIEPENYEWKESNSETLQWQRRALASDAHWLPRPKNLHEMYISASLILKSSMKLGLLRAAATNSWRHLRFKIPELGINVVCGEDGVPILRYQIPSDRDIDAWVDRTLAFKDGGSSCGFHELRDLINLKKDEGNSLNAYLLVRIVADAQSVESSSALQVILNVDHQITDGVGIRIILGKYLALLASFIADQDCIPAPEWPESHRNLQRPWLSMMNSRQVIKGPEYLEDAEACRDALLDTMTHNPGLPLLPREESSTQETNFTTLTAEQTSKLLHAIKTINPDANITHLGHAAMIVAALRHAPLSSTHTDPVLKKNFISPCWLNGRRYLDPSPEYPEPQMSFIPMCQSFAPINFGPIENLVVSPSATKEDIKNVLIHTSRIATSEYKKLKEKKSVLPGSLLLLEFLGQKACLKWLQEKSMAPLIPREIEPAPPLETAIPTVSAKLTPIATQDPLFLSDGITEQYISHLYPYHSNTDTNDDAVFKVEDVQFAANAGKETVVRMSSWCGSTTISGEWNAAFYERGLMTRFLKDLVDVMLCLIVGQDGAHW